MSFWANTTVYEASTSKHELLVNSMIWLNFVAFRMTSGWFKIKKLRQLHSDNFRPFQIEALLQGNYPA